MAPGKTPAPILDGWNKALIKTLNDKEVVAALGQHDYSPAPMSREDLAKFIVKESATWSKIIKDNNNFL
jgi:tripartite-type tricarboxylate transporter receptor subunit TctC